MSKSRPSDPTIGSTIHYVPDGSDPIEFLRQQMDDCPQCREARARGEVPKIHVGPNFATAITRPRKLFRDRPRWRTFKRHVR